MKKRSNHLLPLFIVGLLSFLTGACMKIDGDSSDGVVPTEPTLSIGTLRSEEGVRYLRIDPVSAAFIDNPSVVADYPDGTRVFAQYQSLPDREYPSFCTEAVSLLWVSPIDVGTVTYTLPVFQSDPVDIIQDWATSLEDGFLTLHYSVSSSGKVKHTFTLSPGANPLEFYLLHDAGGDQGGTLTDGVVCFPAEALLPETVGEEVILTLIYLNLQHTKTELTVAYRSPK